MPLTLFFWLPAICIYIDVSCYYVPIFGKQSDDDASYTSGSSPDCIKMNYCPIHGVAFGITSHSLVLFSLHCMIS